jgi:hypothetical protein
MPVPEEGRESTRQERKRFLLRLNPDLHEALDRWASDELRSVNGQIEFLLTEAVRRAGREKRRQG